MDFTKMHGLGNDFIIVDNLEGLYSPEEMAGKAPRLCHRNFGIGGDGLVLLNRSEAAAFQMQIFKPDGSEAEMCGNAIRCLGKYVWERKLIQEEAVAFETGAGVKEVLLHIEEGSVQSVRVKMGQPVMESDRVPLEGPRRKAVNEPIKVGDRKFEFTAVSMGNPHCVIFLDAVEAFPWKTWGAELENHSLFPRRTNVEFVEVLGPGEIRVKVWERGAGPTLACGTGACAATVAGVVTGRLREKVAVHLPGGTLQIHWEDRGTVFMDGPAEEVFHGEIKL